MSKERPRALLLFYVLVAYIGFQFIWWSYLLTNLTAEVSLQKEAELRARIADEKILEQELKQVEKKHHTFTTSLKTLYKCHTTVHKVTQTMNLKPKNLNCQTKYSLNHSKPSTKPYTLT